MKDGRLAGILARTNWTLLLFLLPGMAMYLVFFALPTVAALGMSFTNWDGISNSFEFVGLSNYKNMATNDPIVHQAFFNNVKFTLTVLIFQTVLSLLLALLLIKNTTANIIYRAIFFFPTVIAAVSVALVWILMYDPNIGAINIILESMGLGALTQSWLGNDNIAIYSLATVQFWQHTGQVMIIFIAGLQAIPKDYYEVASLEGASRIQTFFRITLPMLAPSAAIVMAYTTVQTFRAFDLVIALTDGGPGNATEILSTWIYHEAFRGFNFGYASTGAVLFAVVLAATTWFQFRVTRTEQ
jgi:raffinose/stachyose/melibiose transport system permease protein